MNAGHGFLECKDDVRNCITFKFKLLAILVVDKLKLANYDTEYLNKLTWLEIWGPVFYRSILS